LLLEILTVRPEAFAREVPILPLEAFSREVSILPLEAFSREEPVVPREGLARGQPPVQRAEGSPAREADQDLGRHKQGSEPKARKRNVSSVVSVCGDGVRQASLVQTSCSARLRGGNRGAASRIAVTTILQPNATIL
jgi:hypothetical protein